MTVNDPGPVEIPELDVIRQVIAGLEADQLASRERDEEAAAQQAESARRGDLGPDWQEVQRRIDAGETSLRDVFGGVDQTPAAQRLLDRSQRNLTELGELIREQDGPLREQLDLARDELEHLDRPMTPPDPALAAPVDGAPRPATEPVALRDPDDLPDPPAPSIDRPPSDPLGRDPVADRVDATGLEPPRGPEGLEDPDDPDDEDGAAGGPSRPAP